MISWLKAFTSWFWVTKIKGTFEYWGKSATTQLQIYKAIARFFYWGGAAKAMDFKSRMSDKDFDKAWDDFVNRCGGLD